MSTKNTKRKLADSSVDKSFVSAYRPFVALHVGAGNHSKVSIKRLRKLCRTVIHDTLELMSNGNENNSSHINSDETNNRSTKNKRPRMKYTTNYDAESEPSLSISALEAAIEACKTLENCAYTNSGYGSPLNEDGYVECDASIMISVSPCSGISQDHLDKKSQIKTTRNGLGASVGCCRMAKNPVEVAGLMLKQQLGISTLKSDSFDILGRVKPSMLVGPGADSYARRNECAMLSSDTGLISVASLKDFLTWKEYLPKIDAIDNKTGFSNHSNTQSRVSPGVAEKSLIDLEVKDTIGVICGDSSGRVVVCASSGGVALKPAGRIGPAALIGSGIHLVQSQNIEFNEDHKTENQNFPNQVICAVCTTGTGEDIMTCQLASNISKELMSSLKDVNELDNNDQDIKFTKVDDAWLQKNIARPYLQTTQHAPLYVGFLGAVVQSGYVDIEIGTTTENMIAGYGVCSVDDITKNQQEIAVVENSKVGKLASQGFRFSVV